MSNQIDNKNPFEEESQSNISDIINLYLPFWPVFVLTVTISVFVAFMYIRYQTPIYKANATLILKDEESGAESVLKAMDVSVPKKNVTNEIEILKSQNLMSKVVVEMGLYSQIYIPGRVQHLLAYTNSPVTFVAIEPEKITPTPGLVAFTYYPKEKAVKLGGKKYPLEVPVITPYGKFRINYNHLNDVAENQNYFLSLNTISSAAKGFAGNLIVMSGSNKSTILNLSFTDPSPKRAEDVLNSLIRVYNQAGIDDKNTMSKNTLDFIEDRLAKVTIDLSNVEGEIEQYKQEKGIVDITAEGGAYLSSVQGSDNELSGVQIKLTVLDQIEDYVVRKTDNSGTVPATMGISDPLLLSLLSQLYEAELQLDRLRKTGAESSPAVIAIKSRIAQLKPSLLENIRNLRDNLLVTQRRLRIESNKYSAMLASIPSKQRGLLDIERNAQIKGSLYTFLLQKREETALSYASAAADSRLVNAAEALGFPVSPVKTNLYFIALMIGFLAAVGFVLIREKYNKEIVFRSEIEKATKATILAEIEYNTDKQMPVITDSNRTSIAEQFRSLRTSLIYLGIQKDKKTILFTSSISGDGKSFIAINLGASLAMTNKKVAMIELDLRKPKLSKMLNIVNEPGVTNYLAGLETIDKIIKPVENTPNLFVIPSGSIPPNPTELMLNGKLEILMEQLTRDFDYVIIDSPPIGLVTDAKLLNTYADVTIFVLRHKHTPKKYLKFVNQLYKNKEFNNFYIVFNGLKNRGMFGMGKLPQYGYGNGYGYGYGNESDTPAKKRLFSKSNKPDAVIPPKGK